MNRLDISDSHSTKDNYYSEWTITSISNRRDGKQNILYQFYTMSW